MPDQKEDVERFAGLYVSNIMWNLLRSFGNIVIQYTIKASCFLRTK